jgi:Zn-dependent protease with chaperone function
MVVVPLSKIRRQGLTPVDQRFAETLRRVADLASSEGVRPATVLVGKRVPSPFCPVRPGAYRIAISRKLMVTPGSPTFTALIRHELAHLAHRDVTLSRLGRTLGWVLFPLPALPMITAARRLLLSAQLSRLQLEQMFDNMEW